MIESASFEEDPIKNGITVLTIWSVEYFYAANCVPSSGLEENKSNAPFTAVQL